jgi:hypothetical protein
MRSEAPSSASALTRAIVSHGEVDMKKGKEEYRVKVSRA